jgi:hypothetical protein
MDKSCSLGSDLRDSAEQCQAIVLNLQFQSFQRNASQVGSQDEAVVGFVNVDRRGEDVPLNGRGIDFPTGSLFCIARLLVRVGT